jgi:hypothetical protein
MPARGLPQLSGRHSWPALDPAGDAFAGSPAGTIAAALVDSSNDNIR